MADKSLAVKYRPRNLKTIVGNKGAIANVEGMIKNNSIPNAILVIGPTGTGKTTISRIIADMINKIKVGENNPDVREFNMGSEGKIENIRDLVSSMNLLPSGKDKYRVFILDEAHAITHASKSAILKPLEEPPEHVVVILCTDQPEKLLPSIKGRCVTVKMSLVSEDDLAANLERVYEKEKMKFGEKKKKKLIPMIAKMSQGQARISLQILQAVNNIIASGEESNSKEILELALDQANVYQTDQVAVKILYLAYNDKWDKALSAIGDTNDYAGLIHSLLSLSQFMVQFRATGKTDYWSQPRIALKDLLRDKGGMPSNGKAIKIHSVLTDAAYRCGNHMVSEFHLIVEALSKLYKPEKE